MSPCPDPVLLYCVFGVYNCLTPAFPAALVRFIDCSCPLRQEQSITYTACLHRFTLNDRKWWNRGGCLCPGKKVISLARNILLAVSFISSIEPLVAPLGSTLQVSQTNDLCKVYLHTHTHTLLMSILIQPRQNGVSTLAQRKETGSYGFERCPTKSRIPSQGKCLCDLLQLRFSPLSVF